MCTLHPSFNSQALIKASFEGLGELEMSARLLVTWSQTMTANSNVYEQLLRGEGAKVTRLVLEPSGCWMEGLEDTQSHSLPTGSS